MKRIVINQDFASIEDIRAGHVVGYQLNSGSRGWILEVEGTYRPILPAQQAIANPIYTDKQSAIKDLITGYQAEVYFFSNTVELWDWLKNMKI